MKKKFVITRQKWTKCDIMEMYEGIKSRSKYMLYLIYVLILIIFALAGYAIMQIRLYGIKVKDFWNFVEANQILDRLYEYSKRYDALTQQEQVLYLREAEVIFEAFEKMPNE